MRSFSARFAILFLALPLMAFGQSDGSARPDALSVEPQESEAATSSALAPMPATTTPSSTPPAPPSEAVVSEAPRPTPPLLESTPTVSETATATVEMLHAEPAEEKTPMLWWGAAALALLGLAGAALFARGGQKNEKAGEEKCGSIKELLETKKRELEEMLKEWPEEKLKKQATQTLLDQARKDPQFAPLIAAGEKARERIGSLQKTIALLETRFDLCMLSLPPLDANMYEGSLIENSLSDRTVLEHLKITHTYQKGEYSHKSIAVSEKHIEKLQHAMVPGPWHMRFRKKDSDTGFVVFKDRRFTINYADEASWAEAKNYGIAQGIPSDDLIFSNPL